MNEEQLIQLIQELTQAELSYPFNRPGGREKIKWSILKHPNNQKILAMVFTKDNRLTVNLKLTPEHNEIMRKVKGVHPGYHMNKIHWSSIWVNETNLSLKELENMILESAKLTTK